MSRIISGLLVVGITAMVVTAQQKPAKAKAKFDVAVVVELV